MKITKSQLKQIIQEELSSVMLEDENKQQLVNQAEDRIRSKIRTLPGVGGRGDIAPLYSSPLAREIYRVAGGDRGNVLKLADLLGNNIVKLSREDIDEDGSLDGRIVNEFVKNFTNMLKKRPDGSWPKKAGGPKPGGDTETRKERPKPGVAQGELKKGDVTMKLRREGGYIIVTATHKSGVEAEGKIKLRGNLNAAREAAMARARDAIVRKLQGK